MNHVNLLAGCIVNQLKMKFRGSNGANSSILQSEAEVYI